jgi:hypothetical protein
LVGDQRFDGREHSFAAAAAWPCGESSSRKPAGKTCRSKAGGGGGSTSTRLTASGQEAAEDHPGQLLPAQVERRASRPGGRTISRPDAQKATAAQAGGAEPHACPAPEGATCRTAQAASAGKTTQETRNRGNPRTSAAR